VKVFGTDMRIVFLPWKTRFVRTARIERVHVGIKSRDDLHDVESLLHAIGGELFETLRPAEAMAEPHPPRVTQPEKRRAIRVFEMAFVFRDAHGAVPMERIFPVVGFDKNTT